ncbi:MAG: LamG domain-containing protein [Spirochaetales bacterium]|nr:LamG domain-containing protein [Spirochaetales bacterium]
MRRLFYSLSFLSLLILIFFSGCNLVISLLSKTEPDEIILNPQNLHVAPGEAIYYHLYRVDSSTGEYIDVSDDAQWSSNDETIAVALSDGYVMTYVYGTVSITARYNGSSESARLFVVDLGPDATPTPMPGLIAEYKFEGNCTDSSGNYQDAAGYNIDYSIDRFGNASRSALFNGLNAYVETPIMLNSPGSFTICTWVKVDSLAELDKTIMGNCSDKENWNGFWFQFYEDNHRFYNSYSIIDQPSGCVENRWYHIAYAYDNNKHTLTLYVDGTSVASKTMSYSHYSDVSTNYIGAIGSGDINNYLFKGSIDDVMIFNRALSSNEVFSVYTMPPPVE